MRSDSFSGVERYICDVTGELRRRGWEVVVVGGDPAVMTRELPVGTPHLPARTATEVAWALVRMGRRAVVHAHMTAAEAPAVVTRPLVGSRIVCTRHFADKRGSSLAARALAPVIRAGLARQLAISEFVAQEIGEPSVVVYNGVPPVEPTDVSGRGQTVLVMQRHESEKETSLAIRAWALARARGEGWRLLVAGRGSQTGELKALAQQLGLDDDVDFLGFVDDPKALMRTSGLFLATAPREPFGLSVVASVPSLLGTCQFRLGRKTRTYFR